MIDLHTYRKPGAGHVFLVWRPDDGESEADATEVRAWDAEEAAEDFCEQDDSDSAEYYCAKGNECLVAVKMKDGDDGFVHHFKVTGEYVPQYSAREVEP